jgi:hypothetical protein
MRGQFISRYFNAFADGDPVALIATAVFVVFVLVIAIISLRLRAIDQREEEERRKKWGYKNPKEKK